MVKFSQIIRETQFVKFFAKCSGRKPLNKLHSFVATLSTGKPKKVINEAKICLDGIQYSIALNKT
jgi:hypothetical protein